MAGEGMSKHTKVMKVTMGSRLELNYQSPFGPKPTAKKAKGKVFKAR
jgi:hypothetical protein